MTMSYQLGDSTLAASSGDQTLFRYRYRPDMPPDHTRRHDFHPIHTLSGVLLTDAQPADHAWHCGLSYAVPHVNGANCWGGGNYVHEQGYVALANHGRVEHLAFESDWVEYLHWLSPTGAMWIMETRSISASVIDTHLIELHLTFSFHNVAAKTLEFASPAVKGRAGAGHGGLFWRGAPAMRLWIARTGDFEGDYAVLGAESAWLMLDDPHNGTTVVLRDDPTNPQYPTRWFVRQREFPSVCIPLAYAASFFLRPRESLNLTCSISISVPES